MLYKKADYFMVNNSETNYLNWFGRAEEDELSIQSIIKGGGAFSTACFLAQQLVEKCLKGLLVFFGRSFPKVHDLLELETLLLNVAPTIKDYEIDLDLLSNYYFETRYPGDYPELTLNDAQVAFTAAQRIKVFVLQIIVNQ